MTRRRLAYPLAALAALLAGMALPAAASATAAGPPSPPRSKPVCPGPIVGAAGCHSRVVTSEAGTPHATAAPTGYGPAELRGAYELPATSPVPQTIALVAAYDNPTIESDLAVYSETYGLPQCTTANGCFRKVNQDGEEGPYPKTDSGWALEIAMDVQIAHAICQNCDILLVEADSNLFSDLRVAVETAAELGATQISNSYGASEFAGAATDTAYDQPGIAVTVSSGDFGLSAEYPASSPYVVAVGGTTLQVGSGNTYGGETVWSGAGSGCSAFFTARPWQTADPNWGATGCGSQRGIADVAAVADPATGASVYDTTKYKGQSGWFELGGTSLSAPLIAGVYALAGGGAAEYPAVYPYEHQEDSPASLHDVTVGSNGSCEGATICNGAPGYDGPTGVGTPKGVAAFGEAPAEPHLLTVTKTGSGQGWIHSEPDGINCGLPCTAKAATFEGEVVLTAYGTEFVEWASCPGTVSGSGRECTVDLSGEDQEAVAEFGGPHLLTVEKEGNGQGWIHSEPDGINCGLPCTAKAATFEGEVVLTAYGTEFVEWASCPGTVSGSGRECTVTMNAAKTAVAEFGATHLLTVTKTGSGQGWIHSEPDGINCGLPCTEKAALFAQGTVVLIAYGAEFVEWTVCPGLVSGSAGRECEIDLQEGKAAEARFEAA